MLYSISYILIAMGLLPSLLAQAIAGLHSQDGTTNRPRPPFFVRFGGLCVALALLFLYGAADYIRSIH